MAAQAYAEVVGTPYKAWVGPVGTVAPAIDAAEAAFDPGWFLLGTNGINNQGAAGVTVNLGRTMTHFTPAGGTLPVKSWTTDEAITVDGSLVDVSIEQFGKVLDDTVITSISPASGRAGQKTIDLVRGVSVHYYALLIRGLSPYEDGTGLNAQYEFARVYQSAAQAVKYLKGTPAELAWQFTVAGTISGVDPALYRAQNAPHS